VLNLPWIDGSNGSPAAVFLGFSYRRCAATSNIRWLASVWSEGSLLILRELKGAGSTRIAV